MGAQECQQWSIEKNVEVMVEMGKLEGLIVQSGECYAVKSFSQKDTTY